MGISCHVGDFGDSVQFSDQSVYFNFVYGIYFPTMKPVAHCGLVERCKGDFVYGIEGNTGSGGGRNGDGVYKKVRHKRTIYQYADWEKGLPIKSDSL